MKHNHDAWVLIAAFASLALYAGGCSHAKPKIQPGAASAQAKPAEAPQAAQNAVQPVEAGEPVVRNDRLAVIPELAPVYFDFDSDLLKPEETAVLQKNAEWLKAHEGLRIQVAGHCDQRGTVAYNLALGQRRAAAVRSYYESLGISGSRVATISYGKEVPVCDEPDESCYSRNRNALSLQASPVNVSAIFASWPRLAQLAARTMIQHYGPPQRTSATELTWSDIGPWKTITVHKDAAAPLEETVAYVVPAEKLGDVQGFHHGITVHTREGSLSARSDSEADNRLALNLAGDITTGKMTPAQAGLYYEKTIHLEEAGKTTRYTERLLLY